MDGPFFALVVLPFALLFVGPMLAAIVAYGKRRVDGLVALALPHASNTEKLQLDRLRAAGRPMARAKLAGKILDRAEALIED